MTPAERQRLLELVPAVLSPGSGTRSHKISMHAHLKDKTRMP